MTPASLWRPIADRHFRRCLQTVRSAVRAADLWRPGATVGWACSGGADSVAGLLVCAALRKSLGHQIVVFHVDHGLAATSGEAVVLVQQLAAELGLGCRVARVDLASPALGPALRAGTEARPYPDTANASDAHPYPDTPATAPLPQLEARARAARYAALAEMAAATGCTVLATAHHADDQAETLLLRLARGAGSDALAGISQKRTDGVVRPLLGLSRADLRQILGDRPHWTDPSNAQLAHSRNRLRHLALPALESALPGAALGLARTAAVLAETRGGIDAWLDLALRHTVQREALGLRVPRAAVPTDPAALTLLIRWVAAQLQAPLPSARATSQFLALAAQPGPSTMRAAGWQLVQTADAWQFVAATPKSPDDRQNPPGYVAQPRGAD